MVDTNAPSGLKWVKHEIFASLRRVRGSLDEFVEADGAKPQLAAAVDALSEVRSVLSALELVGPARLAAEMQIQCEDLQAQSLPNRGHAAEALMLALIQLPHYLDRLEGGQADVPLALLPSINDLRGSRGAASLTEAELLVPASVLANSEIPASDVQRSLRQVARKIRPHFHLYLLQWLREDTSRLGLTSLGRLFHRLQRHIGAGIFHELFLVAEAVVEALLEGTIAADARTKALIAHLDRVIKPFATDPQAWPEADAQAQLFDLLSLISRCRSSSYRINELRSIYGLERIAEAEETMPAALVVAPEPESPGVLVAEEQSSPADEPQAPIEQALPIDAELRESFLKAAEEEAQTIRHQFALWRENDDEISLTTLRHSFHGLKDSGRLVGPHPVGEFARAVEMLLDRVLDGTLGRSAAVTAFLEDAVGALPDLLAAEAHERSPDVAGYIARAESLALSPPGRPRVPDVPEPEQRPANVIPWPAAQLADAPSEETGFVSDSGESEVDFSDEEAAEIAALAEADDELLDNYRREAREHLEVLRVFVSSSRAEGASAIPDEPVVHALHALAGGARMIGLASTAKVTEHLERLIQDHREQGGTESGSLLPLLDRAIDALEMRLTHLPGYGNELAALRALSLALEERAALRAFVEATNDIVTGKKGPAPGSPAETASLSEFPEASVSEGTIPPQDLRETPIPAPEVEDDELEFARPTLDTSPEQINEVEQRADIDSVDELVQALLVQIGEQVFAIPQASVEAVSRIAQSQLEACYQGQAEDFSHAGRDYRVINLGSMLQLAGQPDLDERLWQPVLLARSGDQRIAFHVDQMLETQRIVVKPLGPELGPLPWFCGGTILSDGRVAPILDLLALTSSAAAR